jgi:pimeloyl-ACP methyl ester carboxylesterase/glycine cleavage system regulatory protein
MSDERLSWRRIDVDGRSAIYGAGGDGPPVMFLHGWALGSRAYARAVRRLTRRGCRVYTPAMPSFGGTADLPRGSMSIEGYADWVDAFMGAVGVEEPALVIGHSFGGGVAIKLAHTHPERVGYLVLLNSVGGVTNRPIWEWAVHLSREIVPTRQGLETMRAMRDDLVANLVRNPIGLMRAGELARSADLRVELGELRDRGLPVLALTTDGDGVIPRGAFEALCSAVGTEGRVLAGRHSWLLADPDSFDQVLGNVVEVRVAHHHARVATSRADEIAGALRATSIPTRVATRLLRDAPPLWLMSAPPPVLAADLALCHPRLGRGEVRAVARGLEGSRSVRLTVVAGDRAGLLADTAAVLADHGLSVAEASAATWSRRGIALHALTLHDAAGVDAATWQSIGAELRRAATTGAGVGPRFVPVGRVRVTVDGTEPDRSLVRVRAPDQVGLLAEICRWFADHGLSIESVHAATDDAVARDVFLVTGECDASALAAHLDGRGHTATVPAIPADLAPLVDLGAARPSRTNGGREGVSTAGRSRPGPTR